MPQSLDFRYIRHVDGSASAGFEEFCCQVARIDRLLESGAFRRFRPPEGGVEATFERPSGELEGWQAKYFLSPDASGRARFRASERSQVVQSFETALKRYPALTKYNVCLPMNLTNGRENPEWERTVAVCQAMATDLGRDFRNGRRKAGIRMGF
ncbi:hypothetical protein A3A71_03325 [Candidatus Berkelbacteria bacterium RIFCSPLOWO2_01_FULL_50_28]|uniref:Uncharacterized protein n=1 Tax=Candidatus Berkelbacteria bacterium RIFCSPLOWO2_01_FULL_50_28 TaxID=1797471 RepID=A0A1F5ECG0_9BACT|nr:MAG: hypothetical protein A2807_02890 [Candidatus Berkelbacteria bacterium RIFCSPHIGHO2_01_FULL_50_36]OGD65092.1 MAG: hypothetical protein A3A71_03325 [Candidatus Berkelbacteria bacterium RIFCSPLOWO2_01_FULL_50_28]